jgi:hypothetical protein
MQQCFQILAHYEIQSFDVITKCGTLKSKAIYGKNPHRINLFGDNYMFITTDLGLIFHKLKLDIRYIFYFHSYQINSNYINIDQVDNEIEKSNAIHRIEIEKNTLFTFVKLLEKTLLRSSSNKTDVCGIE